MDNHNRRKATLRRRPLLVVLIILIGLITALVIAKLLSLGHDNSHGDTSSYPSQTNNSVTKDDHSDKQETPIEPSYEKPEIIQNEGEDPNTLPEITGVVTSAQVVGNKIIIRVSLDQYLSSGVCTLNMSSENNNYTITEQVINSASTSTCAGFDIPVSELSSGDWSFQINISADGKNGIISGEISI